MQTVFFHIGLHKTGTTAEQQFLFRNRNRLAENGVLYPLTRYHPRGQQAFAYAVDHRSLPNKNHDVDRDEVTEALIAHIKERGLPKAIISSENLNPGSKFDICQYIRDKFHDFNIKILVYLRRQDEYFESLYKEHIRPPNSVTYSITKFTSPFDLNYYDRLKPWIDVFGAENIIVRTFDMERISHAGGLYRDFLENFGLDMEDGYKVSLSKQNETLSIDAIKFLLRINGQNYSHDFMSFLCQRIAKHLPQERSFFLLPHHARSEMVEYYKDSNNRIAGELCGQNGGGLFSDDIADPSDEKFIDIGAYELDHAKASDAVVTLLSEFWEYKRRAQ